MRTLIDGYRVGDFLNASDTEFCAALFRRHSHHAEKMGVGMRAIEVRLDDYENKHFQIHRYDGTNVDISWVHCITPKKK
ncbi:DUF3223 domain-containing protein [Polaromonas sp.]|uniref:DUF3223 domain-containing protein n=1 Tax=Polaromonas sp. TaxID=1869339 RepID=UPI003BAA3A78